MEFKAPEDGLEINDYPELKIGLVLTSAAVGAGHRDCPNEGNHRGIAPTKNGLQ